MGGRRGSLDVSMHLADRGLLAPALGFLDDFHAAIAQRPNPRAAGRDRVTPIETDHRL